MSYDLEPEQQHGYSYIWYYLNSNSQFDSISAYLQTMWYLYNNYDSPFIMCEISIKINIHYRSLLEEKWSLTV